MRTTGSRDDERRRALRDGRDAERVVNRCSFSRSREKVPKADEGAFFPLPPLQQVAAGRQHPLHAIAEATDLQHQAVDLGGVQAFVGTVLA